MYFRMALAVARLQLRVADRRKAAVGTYAWALWIIPWLPLYLLTGWLFDLACLRYRKDPVCRV